MLQRSKLLPVVLLVGVFSASCAMPTTTKTEKKKTDTVDVSDVDRAIPKTKSEIDMKRAQLESAKRKLVEQETMYLPAGKDLVAKATADLAKTPNDAALKAKLTQMNTLLSNTQTQIVTLKSEISTLEKELAGAGVSSGSSSTVQKPSSNVDFTKFGKQPAGPRSVEEIKQLKAAGKTISQLKNDRFLHNLKDIGYTAKDLKDGGYTAKDLKDAGYTVSDIARAYFTPNELKSAGYTAKEMLDTLTFSVKELKAAGFTLKEMKDGITSWGTLRGEIRALNYTLREVKEAGYTKQDAQGFGFSASEVKQYYG